ncbi:hypothetical protein A0256_15335 [Mucilaginibacter sp. PAMC 26640]|nr:hypothetical protein A0256_15335 [Mucilaginibacter sp. PAMC 26640]
MKKIKQFAAVICAGATLLLSKTSFAQSTPKDAFRFGIGVETLAPVGDLKSYRSNFGLGITPQLQYGIGDHVALTLSSGYYHFFEKTVHKEDGYGGYSTQRKGIIPVKLGLKAFLYKNLYISGELGAGFEVSEGSNYVKFISSGGVGYATKRWDVGLRYESFTGHSDNFGTIGLRVAYGL